MAGIGFELRRILKHDTYISLFGAYSYAGLITSGPWILAILTILILTYSSHQYGLNINSTQSFQAIVVYCIAGSLVLSSFFQHSYTRYIADQYYLNKLDQLIPSLNSIYSCLLLLSGCIGYTAVYFLLPDEPHVIRLLVISTFIVLNLIWATTSVLSGLLAYKSIFIAFASSFLTSIILGYYLRFLGLKGLLISFLSGEFLLLMILIYVIYRNYLSSEIINYQFFKLKNVKWPLFFTGFFYNLGIWIDKFMFWYYPSTGINIVGKLNASMVYDTPIFMSYLAVIPGTIAFLMHMETDYAFAHKDLYDRVNGDYPLADITHSYNRLIEAGRTAIYSVIKSQAYVLMIGIIVGTVIFGALSISIMYVPLFCICLLAASLNVIFWATLDIIFYLDKIQHAFFLTLTFLLTNAIFTWISLNLGIFYFGFGLVVSLFVTVILAFLAINREFKHLLYLTYMFSASAADG